MIQDEIIDFLEKNYNQEVLGICIYGSRAGEEYYNDSDMDVLVLVKENSKKLQSIFFKHEDIFIECFVFDMEDLLRIKNENDLDSSSWDGMFVHWMQEPIKILKDTDGILDDLVIKVKSKNLIVTDIHKEKLLKNISRELECVRRYIKNNNTEYQDAFILKLNYLSIQALGLYLALRNQSWYGEKNALIYLKNQDITIYNNYMSILKSIDNNGKMIKLEEFMKVVCPAGYELLDYTQSPVVVLKEQ